MDSLAERCSVCVICAPRQTYIYYFLKIKALELILGTFYIHIYDVKNRVY